MEFKWVGNPEASQLGQAPGGFFLRIKDCGEGWYCAVFRHGKRVFHSGDADILPLSSDAARRLCELVVRVELGRAGHG